MDIITPTLRTPAPIGALIRTRSGNIARVVGSFTSAGVKYYNAAPHILGQLGKPFCIPAIQVVAIETEKAAPAAEAAVTA